MWKVSPAKYEMFSQLVERDYAFQTNIQILQEATMAASFHVKYLA